MFKVSIASNAHAVVKGFEKLSKDMKYVQAKATNDLAFHAQESIKKQIEANLKITKKSISTMKVDKAKKTQSNIFAVVQVNDTWKENVLEHHFKGGDRARKGMEQAMIYYRFMSKDEILTPGPGVKIASYVYTQMMSQLKLNYKAGYSANETKRSRKRKSKRKTTARFFLISSFNRGHHLAPGIYARMKGYHKPICMLRISKKPHYNKRIDSLDSIVSKVIERNAKRYYQNALEAAAKSRAKFMMKDFRL